jgi:uncharacterized protein (TIGR02588 family)
MSPVAKHPLEWAVFAVSAVLVAGTLGYLVWDAATTGSSPPRISVEVGPPAPATPAGTSWTVPVTVRNDGHETAEGVRVEVALERPGIPPEVAEIEIAFVPRESRRQGWVTFAADPRLGHLTGRAVGYEKP